MSTQFYLSSCRALVHCHQPHQKNPVSPSCALWQRSKPESERGRKHSKCKSNKSLQHCRKGFNFQHRALQQPQISAPTHLDAGSLWNRNSPGTVQIIGVWIWVSRREDGAFAISQHATTGNWMKRETGFVNIEIGTGLQRKIQRRSNEQWVINHTNWCDVIL